MMMSEVFRTARNILFERGWTQGALMNPDGEVCLEGACCLAVGHRLFQLGDGTSTSPGWDESDRALLVMLGGACGDNDPQVDAAWMWNDQPGRTFSEVIDALDRAEKLALVQEEADA